MRGHHVTVITSACAEQPDRSRCKIMVSYFRIRHECWADLWLASYDKLMRDLTCSQTFLTLGRRCGSIDRAG